MKEYKVGDKVRIYRKVDSVIEYWNPEMDFCIGKYGTIRDIGTYLGTSTYSVEINDNNRWVFLAESFQNYRKEKLKKILKNDL